MVESYIVVADPPSRGSFTPHPAAVRRPRSRGALDFATRRPVRRASRRCSRKRLLELLLAGITLPLTACSQYAPQGVDHAIADQVQTVVRVHWTTADPSQGYVEFGRTEEYDRTTPLTDSGVEHEALLLGLQPDTEYHYRVVSRVEGQDLPGQDRVVSTGSVPNDLPELALSGSESVEGYYLFPYLGSHQGLAIVDGEGRYVWYRIEEQGLHHSRAQMARSAKGIFFCGYGYEETEGEGEVAWVSWEGEVIRHLDVPGLTHDCFERSDGTVAVLQDDARDWEGTTYTGERILEIDGEGNETEVWSVWDDFHPSTHAALSTPEYWTHANALTAFHQEDRYLVSLRKLDSIVSIDRDKGELQWGFGGQANQFSLLSGRYPVGQHEVSTTESGFVVFDNGLEDRPSSRVVEYAVDEDRMEAEEVWSYMNEPGFYVEGLGGAARLPEGDTLATWGTKGVVQRISESGEIVWEASTDLGYVPGYGTWLESLYADEPAEPTG